MIRWYKIKAMMYLDFINFTHSHERIIEYLFFPITSTIIWGLFANSIKGLSPGTAMMFLVINIFWSFSYLFQSTANLLINMDVWSRSLNQLLISGLSEDEFILTRQLFACIASSAIIALMLGIAALYGFYLPSIGLVVFISLATMFASLVWGILVVALYIKLGKEYAFLSWSFMQLVILFSAPFFPITTYPFIVQKISMILPHTWIFEFLKQVSANGTADVGLLYRALLLSLGYLALIYPFYKMMFRKARKSGALVRLGF
jgi:hypothetical protein